MVYGSRRLPLRVVRYAVTLVSAGGLLLGPLLPALAVSLMSVLIVTLCWGFPERYALPWNRFLGWFVDLPAEDSHPSRRRWASWIGDRLRWNRESAWRYLYAKTFTRGDTFGAFLRWYAVIGLIVAVSVNHPILAWVAFGIGFLIGGVQLTELGRQRWTMSVDTLPIAPEGRRNGAAAVGRVAGTAATMLLWLLTAILHPSSMVWIAPAALAAGLLWNVWLIPRRIGKSGDEEDD
jgi:ABC-2 type transport system permease protein